LYKLGKRGEATSWRRRFFVLTLEYLYYFKSNKSKKPKGAIRLSIYSGVQNVTIKNKDCCLKIFYPPNSKLRNYFIAFDGEEERESWRKFLQKENQKIEFRRSMKPAVSLKPDGIIKFKLNFNHKFQSFLVQDDINELDSYRCTCHKMNLIGVYPNSHPEYPNIGFGNISKRWTKDGQFVVTCSQTGHLEKLDPSNYTLVTDFSLEENTLWAKGINPPSSESLTHAAVYAVSGDDVNYVLHAHHEKLWKNASTLGCIFTEDVPYGTPEMAREVQRVYQDYGVNKLVSMKGHKDGLIIWGSDLKKLIQIFEEYLIKLENLVKI